MWFFACLAGRQAALLARYVYAGAGHSGHTALQSILEGLFRAAYPALLEGAAYMWHLVGQPRKGISSGYWKWSRRKVKHIRVRNVLMTGERWMLSVRCAIATS